uniref:Uncharacterized protein n=1 Tax=Cacopsylla melanoneura TaxID=428564 RepID=A0A8D8UH97_9HEMI
MQSVEAKNLMFRHVWDRFFFYLEYIHVCSVLYLYGYTRRLSGRHFWDRIDSIFGFMTLNLYSFLSVYILSFHIIHLVTQLVRYFCKSKRSKSKGLKKSYSRIINKIVNK